MRLKNMVRIGTIVSVLLFGLAVGYYVIMRFDMMERYRNDNLYSFVPSDCIGVLDSDNIDLFLDDCQQFNYCHDLDAFQSTELLRFLLKGLYEYTMGNGHGPSNQMSRLAVSYHHPSDQQHQIVYFQTRMADVQVLTDMLQEYASSYFLPKEEMYRGKMILVYPLSTEDFLAVYTEGSTWVVSYQKSLVEKVIDARLDESALSEDELFLQMLGKQKEKGSVSLYARTPAVFRQKMEKEAWSGYSFHLNSDVLYLTGDTYMSGSLTDVDDIMDCVNEVGVVHEKDLIVSSKKDSTEMFMNNAFEANENGTCTLFDECVANLSADAPFTMVTDMEKVVGDPQRFQGYLPSFVIENADKLRRFILSVQLSLNKGHLSHIWVFTYKD